MRDRWAIVSEILLRQWLQISQYGHDESVFLLLRLNTSPSTSRLDENMCYYTLKSRYFVNTCSLFLKNKFRVLNFSGCKGFAKIKSSQKYLATRYCTCISDLLKISMYMYMYSTRQIKVYVAFYETTVQRNEASNDRCALDRRTETKRLPFIYQ